MMTKTRFADTAVLFASCGDTARFLAHMRELRVVQQQVAVVAGTSDVSVDLQYDHVLTIRIGNEDASGKPGAGRRERDAGSCFDGSLPPATWRFHLGRSWRQ